MRSPCTCCSRSSSCSTFSAGGRGGLLARDLCVLALSMDAMDGVERLAKKRMLIAFLCVVMDVFLPKHRRGLDVAFSTRPFWPREQLTHWRVTYRFLCTRLVTATQNVTVSSMMSLRAGDQSATDASMLGTRQRSLFSQAHSCRKHDPLHPPNHQLACPI